MGIEKKSRSEREAMELVALSEELFADRPRRAQKHAVVARQPFSSNELTTSG